MRAFHEALNRPVDLVVALDVLETLAAERSRARVCLRVVAEAELALPVFSAVLEGDGQGYEPRGDPAPHRYGHHGAINSRAHLAGHAHARYEPGCESRGEFADHRARADHRAAKHAAEDA